MPKVQMSAKVSVTQAEMAIVDKGEVLVHQLSQIIGRPSGFFFEPFQNVFPGSIEIPLGGIVSIPALPVGQQIKQVLHISGRLFSRDPSSGFGVEIYAQSLCRQFVIIRHVLDLSDVRRCFLA